MTHSKIVRLQLIILLTILTGASNAVFAHPETREDRLYCHFAVGMHEIANGEWIDGTHQFVARAQGEPTVALHGPASALHFDGKRDWLNVDSPTKELRTALPSREITVSAWVSVATTHRWGGIVGALQDNAGAEKGWILGFNDEHFTWGMAGEQSADSDGILTYLEGGPKIEPNRWYHVVGTYDGKTMQLYVNGELVATSDKQSGDILYADPFDFAIGAYKDSDDFTPMDGTLYELKVYGRILAAEEITAVVSRNANLVKFVPTSDEKLQFLVQPYLQRQTTDSIRILCETSRPTTMRVEFGARGKLDRVVNSPKAGLMHEAHLQDLPTFSSFFYQVICTDEGGAEVKSERRSFQTAPTSDMPWSFGVIGDTQRNPEVTRQCAEGLYALRPNFVLHCGDVVDDGFSKNQWLKDLFEPCQILFAHTPVFPVIGNHEQNSHWYYDYFSLPDPEYYYTFQYGNAQFFMIDSNKPLGSDSEQYQWLEKELAKSTAEWKFTCHHHPCFSSDENDYGDHIRGTEGEPYTWGDPNAQHLVPLYEKYGVDIAFNGHIHVYERTWPIFQMSVNAKKGVRYITSGGGGGGLEQAAPQRSWFSLHFKRAHHYCYATLHDQTIQFKAYDLEGSLFDTFELTKPTADSANAEK
jgi:acid phosphatase type 7